MKGNMIARAILMLVAGLLTGCAGDSSQPEVTTAVARSERDLSFMVWQGTMEVMSAIDAMPGGSGKVVAVPAAEGQHVNAGDTIFQINDTDAELSLAQARAGYDTTKAAFTDAQKASDENTGVAPARIEYTDALNSFNRVQELYTSNVVSQVDYENTRSRMDTTVSKLKATRSGQDDNYDAAKAQMDSAKAALDIAQKRYGDCSVPSPITGMITKINVEIDQTVSPQVTGATVIDDSEQKVEIQAADTGIDQLKTGMAINIGLQSAGTACSGTIGEISAVCDPKTGMYIVEILLDRQEDLRYTGLMTDVRAVGSQSASSACIPSKCILSDDSGSYVYTIVSTSMVKTPVIQDRKKNAYMEITQGLEAGNEVVLQSSKNLEDGMKVRVSTVE